MSEDVRELSDDALNRASHLVVHGNHGPGQPGFSAAALFDLLQGTGPLTEATKRDASDEAWAGISPERRSTLLRFERWAELIPDTPAGMALAAARDPALLVLDRANDRVILLKSK